MSSNLISISFFTLLNRLLKTSVSVILSVCLLLEWISCKIQVNGNISYLIEFVGIITWGIGIRKIELDAHRCQPFSRKITVKRELYCLIAKAVRV